MKKQPNRDKPETVRCAIYTRKSTEEGLEQEFNSLDAQRESGEHYIRAQEGQGWVWIPTRYDDGGFTGGNMERPALKRLMEDIEAGKVDCVVVYKVDRLSRSLLDFSRIMETFDKHGVSFVSVTQQFNTSSSMGRLMLNVLLSFAQFEREIISERTRDKMAAARRKGKYVGGAPILGYDVDRDVSRMVVNEQEAIRVRQIFELYLEQQSLIPTIKELDHRGWTTKRWTTKKGKQRGGRPFNKNTLYGLLTNVAYVGKVRYKDEVYDGEHEAIVDPETLRDALFTCRQPPYVDFDPAFYERLKATGRKVKVCWDAECEHLENDTHPIMTWDHWPESWEAKDLSDYRAGFLTGREACQWIVDTLNGPDPAAIWGLSDGDVAWWCYNALAKLPDLDRHWLEQLAATSGLHPEDCDELWPLFDEACRNAPAWLCQSNWDIAERFTQAAFTAHSVGIERNGFRYAGSLKRKIDCNAVYRMLDHGLWWPLLEGKRLAIVSGHADEFAARLADPEFVKATGGGEVTWSVATKINCPDKTMAKREFWSRVRDELFASEWDLLLCSAGSLSAVICDAARERGRRAIDVGQLDQRVVTAVDDGVDSVPLENRYVRWAHSRYGG